MCCLENIRSTVNNPLSTKLADKQAIEANSWGGGGGGGGGGGDENWDRETMFSQLAKRSP